MACTCATEASLFAYLITAYFYLDLRSATWPPAGIERPRLALPIVMTLLLLSSSATMLWGEDGIRKNRAGQLSLGIFGTLVLATGFLVLFVKEYHDKLAHFTPSTHAYASIFYTTTSLHGMHVIVGMIILAFTLLRTRLGHFSAEHHTGVSVASLYWHFVGFVWLSIFTCFYLSPHFQ